MIELTSLSGESANKITSIMLMVLVGTNCSMFGNEKYCVLSSSHLIFPFKRVILGGGNLFPSSQMIIQ